MQLGEALAVGGFGFFEIANGAVAEEEAEHGADAVAAHRQASGFGRFLDAFSQTLGGGFELFVSARALEQLEGLDARSHGQGVSAEGARLIHRASGSHHFHDVLAAAVGAHRQTAANHLAHGGEVGGDSKAGLGSAIGDAEASHHFVEHQQGAVFTGDFPQTFEEAEIGGDKAGIAHHRLEDHTGDGVGVFGKQGLDRLKVVVGSGEGVGGGAARHTGGVR